MPKYKHPWPMNAIKRIEKTTHISGFQKYDLWEDPLEVILGIWQRVKQVTALLHQGWGRYSRSSGTGTCQMSKPAPSSNNEIPVEEPGLQPWSASRLYAGHFLLAFLKTILSWSVLIAPCRLFEIGAGICLRVWTVHTSLVSSYTRLRQQAAQCTCEL